MPFDFLIDTMKSEYDLLNPQTEEYSLSYKPLCDVEGLILEYPTAKTFEKNIFRTDYRLSVKGIPLSHVDIIRAIENYLHESPKHREARGVELSNILISILNDGLRTPNYPSFSITIRETRYDSLKFVQLIYWLIGQEEINYPQSEGKKGVRLPMMRYHEAIVAVVYGFFEITTVEKRIKLRGRPPLCLEDGIIDEEQTALINDELIQNINIYINYGV